MPENTFGLLEEILTRPNATNYLSYPSFNSRTLRDAWETATGSSNYRNRNNPEFAGNFFKYFWQIIKYLGGRDENFKKFTDHWINICRDHSSRYPEIESCDRLLTNMTRYAYSSSPTDRTNLIKGCSRLYYIASGINNIPNTPSDQTPDPAFNYTYLAEESHALQKKLIKLRGGDSITTKIYKDRFTSSKIIYFNKYDVLAVAYLQVYALTQSWPNYVIGNITKEPTDISKIIKFIAEILNRDITETTWQTPVKDSPYLGELYHRLKTFEDNLRKIVVEDGLLESFSQAWQQRLHQTEKDNANRIIEQANIDAKQAMDNYYKHMETVREKQKFVRTLSMDEDDANFLINFFNLFKAIPGAIFHEHNNTLFCLYEVPFAHSDYSALKKHINYISEDMNPRNETDWHGSAFAQALWYAIRKENNENCWSTPLIPGFRDKEYWPAFIKAYKRLLIEVFVDRKTAMYLSSCLKWDAGSNNYQPQGTKLNDLPVPFQQFINERLWHPHIVYYNCWSAAQGEITKALSNRDFQTAFEYTMSASGQISFPETAGTKIAHYILGTNRDYYAASCKAAADRLRIYQRLGQSQRETLREVLTVYLKEELGEREPAPIIIPKTEMPKKSINDRLVWLEQNRFTAPAGTNITSIPSETDTRFEINGESYIFLPSGDFLTPTNYTRYAILFPDAPMSAPSSTAGTTTINQAPEEEETHTIVPEIDIIRHFLGGDVNIAYEGNRVEPGIFHLRRNEYYVSIEEALLTDVPEELREHLIAYNGGQRTANDDYDYRATIYTQLPQMPEASVRITKAPSGRYYTRITGQERTYYQRIDTNRNSFIQAFDIPENELHLIAPPDRQRMRATAEAATEVYIPADTRVLDTTEPDPAPRYIDLFHVPGSGWKFPRAALLPNEFQEFSEFIPEFNGEHTALDPDGPYVVRYDTLEDIIIYENDGTLVTLATNVLEQVRGDF